MKVILVEDNENTAVLTQMYLEKTGVADHIDHTHRLKTFEHLINRNKYDLALIDYHLQFFDAPEFIQLTKDSKLNARTPIIVVSHEISMAEEREIERLGAQYIRRHDDYMVFIELIRKALRRMN